MQGNFVDEKIRAFNSDQKSFADDGGRTFFDLRVPPMRQGGLGHEFNQDNRIYRTVCKQGPMFSNRRGRHRGILVHLKNLIDKPQGAAMGNELIDFHVDRIHNPVHPLFISSCQSLSPGRHGVVGEYSHSHAPNPDKSELKIENRRMKIYGIACAAYCFVFSLRIERSTLSFDPEALDR